MRALVRFALGLANVPDDLVADLDKSLPGAGRVIDAAKAMDADLRALEPILEQAMPHLAALAPLLTQAKPHIDKLIPQAKAAYPDIVAILPTLQRLAAFVEGK